MPISPKELLETVNLPVFRTVRFTDSPRLPRGGVYIVSSDPDPTVVGASSPQICGAAVEEWLEILKTLKPTKQLLSIEEVVLHLNAWWLPDEGILYIGKATNVSRRVREMRIHTLGYSKKHAGGHWIHALRNKKELYIHCAEADKSDPEDIEAELLRHFSMVVSDSSRARRDAMSTSHRPRRVDYLPYANLEWRDADTKVQREHDLKGYTVDPLPQVR